MGRGRLHFEDIPRKGGTSPPGPYLPLHTDRPPSSRASLGTWVASAWDSLVCCFFAPLWEHSPLKHRYAPALAFWLWLKSRQTCCLLSKFCSDPLAIPWWLRW